MTEGAAASPLGSDVGESLRALEQPVGLPPGMLGIPCKDTHLPVQSAEALFALAHTGLPHRSAVIWSWGPSTIAANRNRIARTMLQTRAVRDLEWVCMCDSDAVPPRDAILRLLARNVDVVGALYCLREKPYKFGFGRPRQPVPEPMRLAGLLEVEWVGTHFILIRRRVLERVREPWFDHLGPGFGEDVYFCRKARKAGFKVYVDLDLEVGHLSWVNITKELALAYGETGLYRGPAEVPDDGPPPAAAAGD